MSKKQLEGIVVSDKMQKTVVVRVETLKRHPRYHRVYRLHKRYKAHDEKREYREGDRVIIEECRPLSKDKRWKIISRTEKQKNQKTEKQKEVSF